MCRVVIVDDRATNRAIYSQLARSIGQDVVVNAFGDPAAALDWLEKNKADLIVTDYDMPRMHGEAFITRFRALPGSGGVPIMMITVCDRRQLRLRALESGATDFLRAPIDHCEFLSRARNLLKLSRSAPPRPRSPCCVPEAMGQTEEGRDDARGDETSRLLSQCGDGGYAIHFIESVPNGEAADLTAALRGHLRGGDRVFRLDPLRYALLQTQVTDASHARVLSARIQAASASFEGVATFRMGTAFPQPGETAPEQRAADCLRAARESARELWSIAEGVEVEADARFALVVDLATGELAGAKVLLGEAAMNPSDFDALRAALACAVEMRLPASDPFRISLRLAGEGAETSALRLLPLLIETGASPSRLNFVLGAKDIVADAGRILRFVRGLQALAVGMTLDIGELPARDLQDAPFWTPLLEVLAESRRPGVRFACSGVGGLETASFLRAWAARRLPRAPVLCAYDVPSPDLLPPLRRAGAQLAQGPCFGAPFALRNLATLLAARGAESAEAIEARRA